MSQDQQTELESFHAEAVRGLRLPQKEIPCKYLYDQNGSELFEQICELEEYYPTRTELQILTDHVGEMASLLGESCLLIELGSGSSLKTRVLLDELNDPAGYVPIDISREHLESSVDELRRRYPTLRVESVCADYTAEYDVPDIPGAARRAVYFPGSTIGNFPEAEARLFLKHIASLCGSHGALLIGVDLIKDKRILERAYDDEQGVTEAFIFNLMERMNRELGADFRQDRFRYRAFYNESLNRVEMHLVSLEDQSVRIGRHEIKFEDGESIRAECSHKYSLESFEELAADAGFTVERVWTDPRELFSVQFLTLS